MTQPFVVDFDPVAFGIGPFHLPWIGQVHPQVHWYGLMYLGGFLGAWILGERRRRRGRLPVSRNAFGDLMFYAMMGVIVGGRVWYMLSYQPLSWIWTRPQELFQIWDGGMSFHGGLMGVVLAGWWWSRRNGVHPFDSVDFVAPLVPIGLGLGRIGNFINGELWGKLTQQPWGMIFPSALREASRCALESPSWQAAHWYCTQYSAQQLDQARAFVGDTTEQLKALAHTGALNSFAREPSQLMESFLEGVVMFTVLYIYSRKPRRRYAVSGLFALMYGVFRFSIEFVRDPDPQLGYLLGTHWLTMGQVQSIPLVLLGVFLLWLSRRQPEPAAA